MVIDFRYSLDQIQGLRPAELEHGIRELLRAHRMGHHILVLPRPVAQWLLTHGNLSEMDRSTVFRLERDFAQTADLPRRAAVSIRVQPDNTDSIVEEDGNTFHIMRFDEISRAYTLERTAIVVEDSVADGELYKLMFDFARSKLGLYSTSMEIYHGGGSRTLDVATEKAQEKRIVCAIIDSDKRAPSDRPIPKVEAIRRRAEELSWPLLYATSPRTREIENLIPLGIIKDLPCSQAYPHFEQLEMIADRERQRGIAAIDSFWFHLDVKLGMSRESLERVVDPADHAWMSTKISMIEELEIVGISGFGGNVVEQAVASERVHGDFRKAVRGRQWWSHFGEYLSFLIWLCAAPNRQYA